MVTGMLAVRNLIDGERNDIWSVNTDQEYHEEIRSAELDAVENALARAFGKLDRRAFGVALGTVSGVVIFLATLFLVAKGGTGGAPVGPHLALLGQYFPGYHVTPVGSLVGLVYGFVAGFLVGTSFALLRNVVFVLYEFVIRRRAETGPFGRFLDYI